MKFRANKLVKEAAADGIWGSLTLCISFRSYSVYDSSKESAVQPSTMLRQRMLGEQSSHSQTAANGTTGHSFTRLDLQLG